MKATRMLAVVAAIALGLPTSAVYAHGGNASLIHACDLSNSFAYIVGRNQSCNLGGTAVHWNIEGLKGDKGLTGLQGLPGVDGTDGTNGADSTVPGPKGDTGLQGLTGADGAPGIKGDKGDAGPGITYQGDYRNFDVYSLGMIASYQGSAYISIADNNVGHDPLDPVWWRLLVAKGDTGDQGVQGLTGADSTVAGPKGDTGPQGESIVGPKGDKGDTGDVGPKGDKGDTGAVGPQGPPASTNCPPDSVRSGPSCIDMYEASVWETTDAGLIAKIQDGTATLADLNAAGAINRGVNDDDYDAAGCTDEAAGCLHVYAVSIPGVKPSRYMTWFQAVAFARKSGKRLPTNAEWQMAALGTPDIGPGAPNCNTFSGDLNFTGEGPNCVSNVGAYDMIGNLWERVADSISLADMCAHNVPIIPGTDDYNSCGITVPLRGGWYGDGIAAGVYAFHGGFLLTEVHPSTGFRAIR